MSQEEDKPHPLDNLSKDESNNNAVDNADEKKSTKESAKKPTKKADDKKENDDGYKSRCHRLITTRPHIFLLFVVSVVGFCYHFNIALHQYWDYKTTVSVSNEDPKDYKFQYPSATMCFQDVVPYFKVLKQYPEYEENVERIKEEMTKRNDKNFWTNPETKKFTNISGVSLEGNTSH